MKKLLYSALIVSMVLAFGGATLAAKGDVAPAAFSDIAGHEAEGELTLMAALGIFTGDSGLGGAVKPDDPITRAQFCKVVVTALGKGSTAAGLAGLQPTFTDGALVPTWAWGFVNVASYMGIITGYADGSFGPNNPVTYAEAVTMLIRAVPGHAAQVPAGVWPYNFLFYGVDAGFTGSVDVGFASLPCSRGDMARLLFATMKVNQLYTTGDNAGKEKTNSATLNLDRLFEGNLTYYDDGDQYVYVAGGNLPLGDPVCVVGAKSYQNLLNLPVVAVMDSAEEYCVFIWKTEGTTVKGVFEKRFTDTATGDNFLEFTDGTRIPVVDNSFWSVDVNINGYPYYSGPGLTADDEITVNLNDAGEAVSVTALRWDLIQWCYEWDTASTPDVPLTVYYHDVITSVDKSTTTADTSIKFYTPGTELDAFYFARDLYNLGLNEGQSFPIPKTAQVYINGAPASRDDLAAYDVVKMASYGSWGYDGSADQIFAVSATRKTVEGTVTTSRTTFPGPKYFGTVKVGDVSKEYQFDIAGDLVTHVEGGTVTPKYLEGALAGLHTYLLDENGLVFFDKAYSANVFFAIVTGASTETGTETKNFITVDNHGVSQTYLASSDQQGTVDSVQTITVDGATGEANTVGFIRDNWVTILAIGSDSVTVEYPDLSIGFLDTTAVYADATGFDETANSGFGDAKFIGLAGLKVGDSVYVFANHAGTPSGHIYLLVRDDSPTE